MKTCLALHFDISKIIVIYSILSKASMIKWLLYDQNVTSIEINVVSWRALADVGVVCALPNT